ncbi:TrbC/VirB2 family protein [Jannaschia sp. M317]|uniref:TrbC/VirB2 family protein n=1 Tax=Jannaschia sp. M317 TaxID=2867011 RepID=UPI0021A678B4|nr:TrbC/VirB2 family protein [Jannaschia sp. M317]
MMKRPPKLAATAALLLLASAIPALAQDLSPVTTMLTTVVTALTGPIGRAVGIVAVVVLGVMLMFGRINAATFGGVLVGMAIVFGAATVIDGFAGAPT